MFKIGKPKIDTYKIVRRTVDAFKESGEFFAKYNWVDNAWEAKIFEDFRDQDVELPPPQMVV
jgi:hypothetical protein